MPRIPEDKLIDKQNIEDLTRCLRVASDVDRIICNVTYQELTEMQAKYSTDHILSGILSQIQDILRIVQNEGTPDIYAFAVSLTTLMDNSIVLGSRSICEIFTFKAEFFFALLPESLRWYSFL